MAASGRKRKNPSKDSRDSKRAKLDTATAFSDGFDENCIGDEDDQAMLDGLTEVRSWHYCTPVILFVWADCTAFGSRWLM